MINYRLLQFIGTLVTLSAACKQTDKTALSLKGGEGREVGEYRGYQPIKNFLEKKVFSLNGTEEADFSVLDFLLGEKYSRQPIKKRLKRRQENPSGFGNINSGIDGSFENIGISSRDLEPVKIFFGGYDEIGSNSKLQNTKPGPLNTLMWVSILTNLAKDLAALSTLPKPNFQLKAELNNKFAALVSRVCQNPKNPRTVSSSLQELWRYITDYRPYDLSGENDFIKTFSQALNAPDNNSELIRCEQMLMGLFINPFFLLNSQ